jgi:hypothetical protein
MGSSRSFTRGGVVRRSRRRSFREKPDPPDRGTGARGRKLLRDTHESTTDPEARLYRKSASGAVVPSYLGHVVTENRNGLIVAAMATQAGNAAERHAAGNEQSQKKRKLVEKPFGWMKQDRPLRQVKLRGLKRVDWLFSFCAAAHDLLRMSKLIPILASA